MYWLIHFKYHIIGPVYNALGPINWFNPATSLCLSKARSWISNVICHGFFMFNELTWKLIVCFVDIGGMVNHHCLKFLFIIHLINAPIIIFYFPMTDCKRISSILRINARITQLNKLPGSYLQLHVVQIMNYRLANITNTKTTFFCNFGCLVWKQ